MTLAVALDPEDSIARSYLGKAYASADLNQQAVRDQAFREWALAEQADQRDPTAPLYRAFAERALNRPAEALRDVQESIARNGNRAVYRSRLLIDSDLATRTTDVASIYRDLGFDQLALSEGYKSVNVDPANPGAHRFLSDTYLAVPRQETASDSELLQSLLLQPLNVQPVRPRLAREGLGILDLQSPVRIGFNEFSPVFASNGLSLLADAFGGTQGTYGENFVVSGIQDNVSFSFGQFFYRTDGIRDNNQLRRDIENGLVQVALSDRACSRNTAIQGLRAVMLVSVLIRIISASAMTEDLNTGSAGVSMWRRASPRRSGDKTDRHSGLSRLRFASTPRRMAILAK
jgi:tetratricopeptide (TPR) repeat protein